MRTQLATVTLISLIASNGLSQEQISLSDEADRINYTIGHQIGSDFKKQQVDLDSQSLELGVDDGHGGGKPRLDAKEMKQRLADLKRNITKDMEADAVARMQKKQAQAKNKRREGREFLAANQIKEGVNTTPTGLQYKVVNSGAGPAPKASDQVKIDYRARRLNGQAFDGSFKKGGPTVFRVNDVIPGFAEALKMMQPGAKWELYLQPELAYGRQGPLADETIIIEVELLEILEPETEQAEKVSTAEGQ